MSTVWILCVSSPKLNNLLIIMHLCTSCSSALRKQSLWMKQKAQTLYIRQREKKSKKSVKKCAHGKGKLCCESYVKVVKQSGQVFSLSLHFFENWAQFPETVFKSICSEILPTEKVEVSHPLSNLGSARTCLEQSLKKHQPLEKSLKIEKFAQVLEKSLNFSPAVLESY